MPIIYNKLIRDRIPEVIQAKGKSCEVRTMEETEYLAALDGKLREELEEYEESRDPAELADMIEVIQAIAAARGSVEELERIRLEKLERRGGFKKRLFLISVEE